MLIAAQAHARRAALMRTLIVSSSLVAVSLLAACAHRLGVDIPAAARALGVGLSFAVLPLLLAFRRLRPADASLPALAVLPPLLLCVSDSFGQPVGARFQVLPSCSRPRLISRFRLTAAALVENAILLRATPR